MKKINSMQIIEITTIAFETIEMVLRSSYISQVAAPGQFLHISVEGQTLRRPISIASVNKQLETVTIIFKIVGIGTKKLATYKVGETINVLGPNGNGFDYDGKNNSTILLIGGGVGIPPLHFLGQVLAKQNVNIISILGYQTASHVFYEEQFKKFSSTYIITNDGTVGRKGFVTDHLELVKHFDYYYSVGPLPMLQAVTKQLSKKNGFISLEEHMGCGVGACFACVIKASKKDSYFKICLDGPVFDAREVKL